MQDAVYAQATIPAQDSIRMRVEKIDSLKEALKHVRNIPDEIRLLGALSAEITALRQLLDQAPQTAAGRPDSGFRER